MQLFQFDYELPPDRIAQAPATTRDSARLMVLQRGRSDLAEGRFRDLPAWLEPGDLLVLNDTRVVPARLGARRDTGARLDMILITERSRGVWDALVKGARRVRSGETVWIGDGDRTAILTRAGDPDHPWSVDFGDADVPALLAAHGRAPLPPYIRRDATADPRDALDRERYQTVYAARPGAIAAPTAGLHFTPELLAALEDRGVDRATVTLHVGAGTFLPVKTEHVDEHRMHAEWFEVNADAVAAVTLARSRGGRVIPVGTTSLRALEAAAAPDGRLQPARRTTDLFIRPGYRFRVADGLITNFHLPRSTLLMLVAALAGLETIRAAYAEAVVRGFRFYSYGDAMFIA